LIENALSEKREKKRAESIFLKFLFSRFETKEGLGKKQEGGRGLFGVAFGHERIFYRLPFPPPD
jgi:hypothetical protein